MTDDGRKIIEKISEFNRWGLSLVGEHARRNIDESTGQWMASRRGVQRISRLPAASLKVIARLPIPLFMLNETPELHQDLSDFEVGGHQEAFVHEPPVGALKSEIVLFYLAGLALIGEDARLNLEESTKHWTATRRALERIARLGPEGQRFLAYRQTNLLHLVEPPALHQFISEVEVGPLDETFIQLSHMAVITSQRLKPSE